MRVETLTEAQKGDIQGIVTSGFGHLGRSTHVGVRFPNAAAGRRWIGRLLPRLTTAKSWRPAPGAPMQRPAETLSLGLTFPGLQALRLSKRALCTFPEAFREGISSPHQSRILGDTHDSAPAQWQVGGGGPELHALVVIYANAAAALTVDVEGVDEIWRSEGFRADAEPFGFRDGMGQPQIAGIKGRLDSNTLPTGDFILGYRDHYRFLPASPAVPVEDDSGDGLRELTGHEQNWRDLGYNGSFCVYRMLGQDVPAFWNFWLAEAERLGCGGGVGAVRLAAKAVGRWPSGAPLALFPDSDCEERGNENEFGYDRQDRDGYRCPFGAHVRRTNPRDQIGRNGAGHSLNMSNAHRILRRASAFGTPVAATRLLQNPAQWEAFAAQLPLADDGKTRGIHFLAVGANLERGFGLIQQQWVNNAAFNGVSGNPDPILGPGGGRMLIPRPDEPPLRTAVLPRFVRVLGGAYLFLPSVTAARWLSQTG